MKVIKPGQRSKRERGSVVIEAALVLPLLLLITAGIIDLGMLYWHQSVLTNATREGARAASRATVAGNAEMTVTQVRTIVSGYLTANNIQTYLTPGSNFFYTWNTATTPPNITVRLINIPVNMMLLPNIQAIYNTGTIDQTVNLTAQTNMAAEWITSP